MSYPNDPEDVIWVNSDYALASGGYVAAIHFTADVSYPLDHDTSLRYAETVLRAAGAADYDAAVYAQLHTKLGLPNEEAAHVIAELRAARPQDFTAGPLTLTPGVSATIHRPFLRCQVRELAWQWIPDDARQHARHVLDVVSTVEYDTTYRQFLLNKLSLGEPQVLAMVADIANFRQEER